MKTVYRSLGIIFISLGVFLMVGIFAAGVNDPNFFSPKVKTCMKARFITIITQKGSLLDVGEIEICGRDISVSPMYGPSMEGYIEALRRGNAALLDELNECREVQSL